MIVFAAVVAALVTARLLPHQVTPALVGLAVNYTLLVPIYLNWVVKFLSDMEMYMTAVERLEQYALYLARELEISAKRKRCLVPVKRNRFLNRRRISRHHRPDERLYPHSLRAGLVSWGFRR